MDTLLKSVLDLVQQFQDSGVTITCNAVLGKETSLTLKWNTSQRPTHSQSGNAPPLRTSTKGKAKHKSPSQRRRDFRRLQAWKASRKHQDVKSSKDTRNGAPSQLGCNTSKSEHQVSVNSIGNLSGPKGDQTFKHSKSAATQSKHVQWENGSSQTQNNPTLTSETQTARVQISSHDTQTECKCIPRKDTPTQCVLISTAIPEDLEECFQTRTAVPQYMEPVDLITKFENHHTGITQDNSWTRHLNVRSVPICATALSHPVLLDSKPKIGKIGRHLAMFMGGLEVTSFQNTTSTFNTSFKSEFVVRHVNHSDIQDQGVRSALFDYKEGIIAKMIVVLKEHIKMHECREWDFQFLLPKGQCTFCGCQ